MNWHKTVVGEYFLTIFGYSAAIRIETMDPDYPDETEYQISISNGIDIVECWVQQDIDDAKKKAEDYLIAEAESKVVRLRDIETALRSQFPHFQNGETIDSDAIRTIGREWMDMTMNWEPQKSDLEFADFDGTIRKIVYETGDDDAGIGSGWMVADQDTGESDFSFLIARATNSPAYVITEDDICPGLFANSLVSVAYGQPSNATPEDARDLAAAYRCIEKMPVHRRTASVQRLLVKGENDLESRRPGSLEKAARLAEWHGWAALV